MKLHRLVITVVFTISLFSGLFAQEVDVTKRGSFQHRRAGTHNGNLVHTIFSNYGVIAQPSQNQPPRGAWKFDNNGYVGDVSPVVGIQLPPRNWDTTDAATDTIHSVVITPVDRPGGGEVTDGVFSGFEPIPGFFNEGFVESQHGVAMSHMPITWPSSWPNRPDIDKFTETADANSNYTPKVDWYGYFGRGREKAATQESYFWMDDNSDREFFKLYGFTPDNNDPARRGQALQVNVRGLQWGGDPVAQNVIFWLYNIKNDGTTTYDQAVFGCVVGTYVGIEGNEWDDDVSFFEVREAITYTWDFNNRIDPASNPRWLPNPSSVGYVAYAFLESPGNGYDGIDNDRDNASYSAAPYFRPEDFNARTLNAGDKIILINKSDFSRSNYTVKAVVDTVTSMGVKFVIQPGVTQLVEGDLKNGSSGTFVNPNSYDGIDNDLDGIIDENYTVHYRQYKKTAGGLVLIDTVNATQYINYLAGGATAPMIDERRDDLKDNDGDWSALDDLGQDGKAGTNDLGEGDGFPTPGEPNVDMTDVHESDQLGLTSFQYYAPSSAIKMADDEDMWNRLTPGKYEVPTNIVNNIAIRGEDGDFVYGSGYFPLLPKQTERFSLALAFGENFPDVLRIKRVVQIIYNANYTFPLPPEAPTVFAEADAQSVHLYWGPESEASIDHITKEKDFEGYKIYKSGRYDFSDIFTVTDSRGNKVNYKEIAQYDAANGVTGYYPLGPVLRDLYNGFSPYLGSDNGLVHEYTDTDVKTGLTYFYVVTAYDRGRNDSSTYPKENSLQGSITRDALGKYSFSKNAVMMVPRAKAPGFVASSDRNPIIRLSGSSSKSPLYSIIDQTRVQSSSYYVTFKDTLIAQKYTRFGTSIIDSVMQGPFSTSYTVTDSATGRTILKDSKVFNVTEGVFFNGLSLKIDSAWKSLDFIQKDTIFWKTQPIADTTKRLMTVTTPFTVPTLNFPVKRAAKDYAIVFKNGFTESSDVLPKLVQIVNGALPLPAFTKLNFAIYDVTDKANPKKVKFQLLTDADSLANHPLKPDDLIFLSDETGTPLEWLLTMGKPGNTADTSVYSPGAGDTLHVRFKKPFTSNDRFVIRTVAPSYDAALANAKMNEIRVVPNPYIVTNLYETPAPSGVKGRGERVIKFLNVPPKSKVHIFTSAGVHIRDLEGSADLYSSEIKWDLRTKEGLDIAFGVYFYVIEAEGLSAKKTGKIAIVK